MSKDDGFMAQLAAVRPITRNLVESIMLDVWPNHTAIVDFGIDSQKHYEALYCPIRGGEITPAALDDALGHGEKLTALARSAPSNPHKDVTFSTAWDVVMGRSGSSGGNTPDSGPTRSRGR